MQQLVVNEATSTAPNADLEQPTEVPLNSITIMFLSFLFVISPTPHQSRATLWKSAPNKNEKNENFGISAYMLL